LPPRPARRGRLGHFAQALSPGSVGTGITCLRERGSRPGGAPRCQREDHTVENEEGSCLPFGSPEGASPPPQDTGNQLAELRAWAARRGLDIAAEYVLDGASAWKGKHRDLLARALADARTGGYDVILTWQWEAQASGVRDGFWA
jgi:hypothetical protein